MYAFVFLDIISCGLVYCITLCLQEFYLFLQECNYKSCKKYLCLQEFYLNSCKNVIINLARNTYCLQNLAGIFARKSCKIKSLARKILYLARNIKTCKSYLVQDFMNHLHEKDHFVQIAKYSILTVT